MARILILLLALLPLLPLTSHARMVEGASPHELSLPQAKTDNSLFGEVTAKVSGWWSRVTGPANLEPTSQPSRSVASQTPLSVVSTTTLNQAEIASKVSQLPAYSTAAARNPGTQAVAGDLKNLRSQKLMVESRPARAASADLPKTKSGVVKFDLFKSSEKTAKDGKKTTQRVAITEIPMLDIGEEAQLSRLDWQVQSFDGRVSEFSQPKALPSPAVTDEREIVAALGPAPEAIVDARLLNVSAFGPDGKVSFETVRKVSWNPQAEKPVTVMEVKPFADEDIRYLQAQILLESGKKCHMASGVLFDLLDAPNAEIKKDALFQLSLCLHKMGLFTESTKRMSDAFRVASSQQIAEALELAVKDLPQEFEEDLRDELQQLSKNGAVPAGAQDAFYYIIAKASARSGHYPTALESAEKVSPKFDRYFQAQFIVAVSEYALGRQGKGYERMLKLQASVAAKGGSDDLKSLIDINLGRMAFAEKKYSESIRHFRDIKKDHPMWVDALIEQGWIQLLSGDASGAIGNMYSIHSPYFKSVYKPESFVVRSIGYLNICQYGDAYRTLTSLEQEYRTWDQQIRDYQKNTGSVGHYNSLVKYLRSPNTSTNIDGLPFQVLREIGRHKDFLNLQQAVNNRLDEVEQHGFIQSLIEKDRNSTRWLIKKSQERLSDFNLKLKKAETNAELAKNINQWRQQRRFEETVIDNLRFELSVYDRSATQYAALNRVAQARIQKKKESLQAAAGEVLKARLKKASARLAAILENNELLRYETFAGSGENIRFHATSTGQSDKVSSKRMPVTAKPESKELKWAFSGEYWADEIGHYRSSLKDNCPAAQKAAAR